MKAGDAFYLPDWGGSHPNFVLEVLSDGSLIVCNFTDYRTHIDKTCVVEIGEHSAIIKRSVVNFKQAYQCECGTPMDALKRQITKNLLPLSTSLLAKVREAALKSPHTSDIIKELLKVK